MNTSKIIRKKILRYLFFLSALIIVAIVVTQKSHASTLRNTIHNNVQQSATSNRQIHDAIGKPTRLQIPKLGIDARIVENGITDKGAMESPENSFEVGWFHLGPRPGHIGSAVIAGHYDGPINSFGIFANLYLLEAGDNVFVLDSYGNIRMFVVIKSELLDDGFAEHVFSLNDVSHLNLVTCEGEWNEVSKSYSKRRVVYTNLVI